MTRWLAIALALTACGRTEDAVVLDEKLNPTGHKNSSEDNLALLDSDGRNYYSDLKGTQNNGKKAFQSFRKFMNAKSISCSGVLAYEASSYGGNVFFYTARHCLQSRTPLGFKDNKDTFVLSANAKWDPPFRDSNRKGAENISLAGGETLKLSDKEIAMDIVRFPQPQLNKNLSSFLPVCKKENYQHYHAIGTKVGSLSWADFSDRAVSALIPAGVQKLLNLAASGNPYHMSGGIKLKAGDSGAPVFAVKLNPMDSAKVDSYECLFGIINREVWVQRQCGSECELKGRSLFQRLYQPSGNWQPFKYDDK